MTTRPDRMPEIDWLKGFAILSVLFIHTRLFDGHVVFAHVINRAVGIFLVLFGMTSELWWRRADGDSHGVGARIRSWYGRRFARLMIAVWASLGLWWIAVASLHLPGEQFFDWKHVLASALGYVPWVGTTWFVTLVLQLVVLFPWLRLLLPLRAAVIALVVASALSIASAFWQWDVIALAQRWFGNALDMPENGWQYYWMFVPRVLWHVMSGIYVARKWSGRPTTRVTLSAGALVLLGVPCAAFLRHATPDVAINNLCEHALIQWLDVPLTIAMLGAFRHLPLPAAARTTLAYCGRASWGIYLGHVLVDELIHLLRWAPRGNSQGVHALHVLVLLSGGVGLVLLGDAAREGASRLVARVRGPAAASTGGRLSALAARGFTLLACATALLAFIALARREWFPTFDNALIWLRTLDVGSRYTPFAGAYSRFGWTHPGPAIYYALALPLRLFGARPSGLLAGVMLIALLAAVVLIVRVAVRAGPVAALACALAIALLMLGLREQLVNPWNPYLLVFPFAAFVASIWLWSDGDDASLPIAAIAGSFSAQAHVGVLPIVVVLSMTAFGLRARWPVAPSAGAPAQRMVVVTWFVLGALWLPPLLDEIMAPSSNIYRVAQFFLATKPGDDVVGWRRGLGLTAAALAPWGPLIGAQPLGMMSDVLPAPIWQLLVPLSSIAAAGVVGQRRGDTLVLRLVVLLLLAVMACIFSYAHIHGVVLGYLAVWTRVIAMFCLLAPALALARLRDAPDVRVIATPVTTLSVGVLLIAFAVGTSEAPLPDMFQSQIVGRFAGAIVSALPEHAQVRTVALGPPFTVSAESLAVVLLRAGREARMQCGDVNVPGPHRCVSQNEVLPTLALASGPGIEIYRKKGGRLLADFDPLPADQRAEAEGLRAELEAQLIAANREDLMIPLNDAAKWLAWQAPAGVDRAQLARYLELASGLDHLAFALFLFPAVPFR